MKGGVCNRFDTDGDGICSNNAKACCNVKRDGQFCHFNDALKQDVKKYGYNRGKYADMKRENKEYHDEEDKYADKIFNVIGKTRNGNPIYDKSKYKDAVDQTGEEILNKINIMRNEWLNKYYRKECYNCDGNCREHNRRARSAETTARASKAEHILNTKAAARKTQGECSSPIQRMNFTRDIKREIDADNFLKAKNMLDDWNANGCGTGPGMSDKKFAELERKILENLKVSAEGGASSKKRSRIKSRRVRKSRKKLRSRKSRKKRKVRKSRKSRRRSSVRR